MHANQFSLDNYPVASVWGLIALKLAGDEIIPFNYVSYASELEVPLIHIWCTQFASCLLVYLCLWIMRHERVVSSCWLQECTKDIVDKCKGFPVSFSPLQKSIKQLESAATKIYKEKKVRHDVFDTQMCNLQIKTFNTSFLVCSCCKQKTGA